MIERVLGNGTTIVIDGGHSLRKSILIIVEPQGRGGQYLIVNAGEATVLRDSLTEYLASQPPEERIG